MTRFAKVTAALAPILLLAACGPGGSTATRTEAAQYAAGGTFTMALPGDIGAFDPYRNGSLISFAALAYDSLVNISSTGEIVSGLAASWKATATSATFTLHDGVTCSDGTPLKASQVAADLDFVKDPKNASPLYGTVVPPVPFTVEADDTSRTVTVKMSAPYGFLLQTVGVVPIVCSKGMANGKLLANQSDGTGPYVLSQLTPGVEYVFTVRKDYKWGPGGATTGEPGTPDKIVAKVITDEATAANLLISGQLNAAGVRAAGQRQRLSSQGFGEVTIPLLTGELWFNQRSGHPGVDPNVRLALTMALDRTALVKAATSGLGQAATGLVASDAQPCKGDTVTGHLPDHDTAKAAGLLDQAGWTLDSSGKRGKNGRPLAIRLRYPTTLGEPGTAATELIRNQWEAIGAKVTLTGDDPNGVHRTMFQTTDFDAYWNPFAFSLPTQLVPFVSGPPAPQGQNFAAIQNADYARYAQEAAAQPAPAACAAWAKAEQALFEKADVVPVAQQPMTVYLRGAEAKTNQFQLLVPASIRLLK
jgi:peptide/nickel transport system substrate-binding protein